MIKDKLVNSDSYYGISENLKKGFEWLKNNKLDSIDDGRYLIDGENIFANVQSYLTKDEAPFEAHKKYVDIQYMIKGEEQVGIAEKQDCITIENYNEDKDVEFLECKCNKTYQILREGEFLVFFSQDAHQPSLKIHNNSLVKKVIVKVCL